MRRVFQLLLVVAISACGGYNDKKELYGYYTPIEYHNTFDTIILKKDFTYQRKVYDKNNVLVLDMTSSWQLSNNHRIVFNGFFLNLDRDLTRFPDLVKDTNMSISTSIETRQRNVGFCVGYFENENCYLKVGG